MISQISSLAPNTPIEWILGGILILVFEFAAPGFILFFFGFSAIAVGVLSLIFPIGVDFQLAIFAVLSVVSLLMFRRRFRSVFKGDVIPPSKDDDGVVGAIVPVIAPIRSGHPGQIEFRGSHWIAESEEEMAVGDTAVIVRRENIRMIVKSNSNGEKYGN